VLNMGSKVNHSWQGLQEHTHAPTQSSLQQFKHIATKIRKQTCEKVFRAETAPACALHFAARISLHVRKHSSCSIMPCSWHSSACFNSCAASDTSCNTTPAAFAAVIASVCTWLAIVSGEAIVSSSDINAAPVLGPGGAA
jgi:hypothetical protein